MAPLSHFLPPGAATASLLVALHYSRHYFIRSSAHLHVLILTEAKWEEKQSQQVPGDELPPEHDSQQSPRASWRRQRGVAVNARAGDASRSRLGGFILWCVINKAAGMPEGKQPSSPGQDSPHSSLSHPAGGWAGARSLQLVGCVNVTPWHVCVQVWRKHTQRAGKQRACVWRLAFVIRHVPSPSEMLLEKPALRLARKFGLNCICSV